MFSSAHAQPFFLCRRYKTPAIRTTLVLPGHIHTQLFASIKAPPQFFFPTVHPIDVVKRVITALDETHSQHIYLPFFTHFMPLLQLLPDWFADFASWVRIEVSNRYMIRETDQVAFRSYAGIECGLCREGLCQVDWAAAGGGPCTTTGPGGGR